MTCASSAACTPRPSTTSRPSPTCRPATRSPAGPASAPGRPTASARSTRTCRRSWSSSPSRPTRNRCRRSPPGCGQSGFLSGEHAGVSFRTGGDPILYINNPPGVSAEVRRKTLDGLQGAQRDELPDGRRSGDAHAHPAIRDGLPHAGQRARPDRPRPSEPETTFKLYGDEAKKPGTFANTVLLARRMVERGVRFVQIYHNNWDTHGNVAGRLPDQCRDVDQACYGLIQDLKQQAACSTRRW